MLNRASLSLIAAAESEPVGEICSAGLEFKNAIATIQAGLVAYHFMHLRHGDRVVILTALASLFWMGILFVLFMSDYMTRGMLVGF